MKEYAKFLEGKSQIGTNSGFKPLWIPDFLYDFQSSLVERSLLKGRAALFEDCGLGKTPQQLVWAENVVRKTNKPVLEARESDEEKHCHPLQLDVIERVVLLWSNPNDIVLTPFMGVGSEVYGAVVNGRRGVGIELKPSYFRQAVKNVGNAGHEAEQNDMLMFTEPEEA
jgi:hypothetical protein